MPSEDVAILTGISWYPNPGYTQLSGPPNDLKIVEEWLLDPKRGAVQPENVYKIETPPVDSRDFDPEIAPPVGQDFDRVFRKLLTSRMKLGAGRVQGRLYLYFSGHGFCHRSLEKPAEAALYCANASREMYEHIFGTHYARVAVGWALFAEVVLIMDCCRDSEVSRVPMPRPYRDTPDDGLAAEVKFLSIYAVPKGAKAQERPIEERNGNVHGLLTHVLLKLLDELPPADGVQISATQLKNHILESWPAICGPEAAPRPDIYLPSAGEVYFPSANQGSPFEFRCVSPLQQASTLSLVDGTFQIIANFSLDQSGPDVVHEAGPIISYERLANTLKLRMKPGLYQYRVDLPAKQDTFKVDGSNGYVEL
ncbi:hypothetical protein SAMN04487926_15317 [Paraburkholderia steynii]|uniref:Caspase domain-containing protein n=1 Tax=Paraburkholderia steynii TaxID=1245441 RepID=A0A7Z7BM42_9BURK|nr:caspase family protein [Paraburkholderia steynii]SDJ47177.1 hypothetical protein SAMN04487926_15317 [Paraburkholderia steynii]